MIFQNKCDIIHRLDVKNIGKSNSKWRSRLVGRGRTIGNRVTCNRVREFESLLLRQAQKHCKSLILKGLQCFFRSFAKAFYSVFYPFLPYKMLSKCCQKKCLYLNPQKIPRNVVPGVIFLVYFRQVFRILRNAGREGSSPPLFYYGKLPSHRFSNSLPHGRLWKSC